MKNVSHAKQMDQLRKPANVSRAKHFGPQRANVLDSIYVNLAVLRSHFSMTGAAHGQA